MDTFKSFKIFIWSLWTKLKIYMDCENKQLPVVEVKKIPFVQIQSKLLKTT